MSLQDELKDAVGLAKQVLSDRKEEKEREQRERRTVQLVCPYCGTSSKVVWEGGTLPNCPSCGAVFDANDPQLRHLVEEESLSAERQRRVKEEAAIQSAKTKKKIRMIIIIVILMIVLMIAAVVVAKLNGGSLHMEGDTTFHFRIS